MRHASECVIHQSEKRNDSWERLLLLLRALRFALQLTPRLQSCSFLPCFPLPCFTLQCFPLSCFTPSCFDRQFRRRWGDCCWSSSASRDSPWRRSVFPLTKPHAAHETPSRSRNSLPRPSSLPPHPPLGIGARLDRGRHPPADSHAVGPRPLRWVSCLLRLYVHSLFLLPQFVRIGRWNERRIK